MGAATLTILTVAALTACFSGMALSAGAARVERASAHAPSSDDTPTAAGAHRQDTRECVDKAMNELVAAKEECDQQYTTCIASCGEVKPGLDKANCVIGCVTTTAKCASAGEMRMEKKAEACTSNPRSKPMMVMASNCIDDAVQALLDEKDQNKLNFTTCAFLCGMSTADDEEHGMCVVGCAEVSATYASASEAELEQALRACQDDQGGRRAQDDVAKLAAASDNGGGSSHRGGHGSRMQGVRGATFDDSSHERYDERVQEDVAEPTAASDEPSRTSHDERTPKEEDVSVQEDMHAGSDARGGRRVYNETIKPAADAAADEFTRTSAPATPRFPNEYCVGNVGSIGRNENRDGQGACSAQLARGAFARHRVRPFASPPISLLLPPAAPQGTFARVR